MTIRFTILGEAASKANSRELVMRPMKGTNKKRPMFIKSEKAIAYEKAAMLQIPATAKQMLTDPVRVTLRMFYATERPDLDESIVLDVLQAKYSKSEDDKPRELIRRGVYVNDRQVREKHVYHGIDKANPRAEIEVEPLEAQQEGLFGLPPERAPAARKPKQEREVAMIEDGKEPF